MVRIQDFHSWHTSSILVESTTKKSPVTTGTIINLKRFKIMVKIIKTAAVKGRETKLSKKSNDELIKIILRKDATEANFKSQVINLKAEVNILQNRINNFDKDMEGTMQTLESYKDKVKTLNEKNDSISIEAKDNKTMYDIEAKKVVELTESLVAWRNYAICASIAAIIAIGLLFV